MATVAVVFLVTTLVGSEDAVALTTSVDATILSGQTISVGDQSFTIYLSSTRKDIAAEYGTSSLFVKNNSCEQTLIARICLDNVQYDSTDRIYKIKVRGISLAPSLSITAREAGKTELYAGEGTKFTVTLKNTGGFAKNITYEEKFPAEFEVVSAEGATFLPDRAVWKGTLDEGDTASFSYTVESKDAFDGSLVASLTYFDGLRLKTLYSSKISLKVSPAFVLLTSIGDSAIIVGERDNVTLNLTNRLPETAVITAEVTFDPGLKVVSRPYDVVNLSQFRYVWNSELLKGSNKSVNLSKALFFEFRGAKIGNSNVNIKVSYKGKSEKAAKTLPEAKQSVVVSDKGIKVRTSLKEATLEAGQYQRIKVWVQNLNPYAALTGVKLNISTTPELTYLPDAFLERLEPQEQALVVDKTFYAPSVSKSTGYVITTGVQYLTEFGDNNSATFKDTATVSPLQGLELSSTPSATTVKSGEEVEVTVAVQSARASSVTNVYIADNVSDDFAIIGKNFATLEVKGKATVTAYRYKLVAPHVNKLTVLYVNTSMKYSDRYSSITYENKKDYLLAKVNAITVEPESLPLAVTRTLDDSDIYVGEAFGVSYRITNNANNKVARNIVLKIPLDYGLDMIDGMESVTIPMLNPGETLAVANVDRRRAKLPGQIEFSNPALEYENIYGDRFAVNGSSTTLSVKDTYLHGPMVLVEKVAPQKANNTDFFDVQLKVKNVGTDAASVVIDDDGRQLTVKVPNGTTQLLNFSRKYTSVGKVELPRAKATYSYNGVVYRTASTAPSVEILNNPVLKAEKVVPQTINNAIPYIVMLRLENRAHSPVENISLKDGEREWAIAAIQGKGHANVSYQEQAKEIGTQSLKAATATYVYGGVLYAIKSNSPVLNVEEKKLVSVVKGINPVTAKKGDNVMIVLNVKNLHGDELEVIVSDNKKVFTAKLMPDEEKNFTYTSSAGETTGDVAAAVYTLNSQQLTTLSAAPQFTLTDLEGVEEPKLSSNVTEAEEAAKKRKGKGNIFSGIINALLSILTWKRGG